MSITLGTNADKAEFSLGNSAFLLKYHEPTTVNSYPVRLIVFQDPLQYCRNESRVLILRHAE